MAWTLRAFMDLLGVDRLLAAYETQPWFAEDSSKSISCSANVTMDSDLSLIEADVYLVLEKPDPVSNNQTQEIIKLIGKPRVDGKWVVNELRIKGQSYKSKIYNWEEKGCNLFRAVITSLERGVIPDFDELTEKEMHENERFADQWGSGSSKAPIIKADQLLDMGGMKGF